MTDRNDVAVPLGSLITPSDTRFHQPSFREFRWLETNCFTFTIPEAGIGGMIWNGFRTNMGVVSSQIRVWSSPEPGAAHIQLDYNDTRTHLPLPADQLHDFRLANGLVVRMTCPLTEWTIQYQGANETEFDLRLRALSPPMHISETGTTDAQLSTIRHGHLDQMMAVTGTVVLNGRTYDVDWPAWRDHSWSPRPEGAGAAGYASSVSSNFDYGAFGNDYVFFAVTTNEWDDITRGVVHNGYIIDNGSVHRIRRGTGRFSFDRTWSIRTLSYELEDEHGVTHHFHGEAISYYHTPECGVLAVVRWTTPDGRVGWGQYDWHGNAERMRALQPWEIG